MIGTGAPGEKLFSISNGVADADELMAALDELTAAPGEMSAKLLRCSAAGAIARTPIFSSMRKR